MALVISNSTQQTFILATDGSLIKNRVFLLEYRGINLREMHKPLIKTLPPLQIFLCFAFKIQRSFLRRELWETPLCIMYGQI